MKPFIPELGQFYFYIFHDGQIVNCTFTYDESHQYRIQTGNCFPTLETAEYHRRMQTKAWEIRQMSFEPDWSDRKQEKYSAYFDHFRRILRFIGADFDQVTKTHFSNYETAREAFDGVSNDDFLYLQRNGLI